MDEIKYLDEMRGNTPLEVAGMVEQFAIGVQPLIEAVEWADLVEIMTFLRSNKIRKRKWGNQIASIIDAYTIGLGGNRFDDD